MGQLRNHLFDDHDLEETPHRGLVEYHVELHQKGAVDHTHSATCECGLNIDEVIAMGELAHRKHHKEVSR